MEGIAICYSENPKHLFLCSLELMDLNPSEYKQYPAILQATKQPFEAII